MTNESILALIDAEIAKLTKVRALLAATGKVAAKAAEIMTKKTAETAPAEKTRKRRRLSAAARKRIADAQRKRWAAQKAKK
ncbi:MAG: hypothetical protein ABSB60_02640 [Terracidiphilus sp.]|jgi:hypothetical protein